MKRLKEERIGYDNQLATIDKCLRNKEKDSQELLLLSQDALKAKQTAYSELKKYENRKLVITKLREKYLGNLDFPFIDYESNYKANRTQKSS